MKNLLTEFKTTVTGHLLIREFTDHAALAAGKPLRTLLNKRNAIHPEHASILLARAVAHKVNGSIYAMHFGTGGATVDDLGNITYATPNTSGAADLNNPVYFEVVDDNEGAPSGNSMIVRHINGTLFSDVEIHCVLDKNEPFTQPAFDSLGVNINTSQFAFDEIGLKTEDDLLVTHVVFAPIQKAANIIIEVIYTLRFRLVTA